MRGGRGKAGFNVKFKLKKAKTELDNKTKYESHKNQFLPHSAVSQAAG